jgi:hypothetical protein
MALNRPINVRFEPAMVMEMDVQYPFLKAFLTANVGKCS